MATFVGSANLEEFILPLMMQALTDPEEFVIAKVLRSLRRMAKLGLFQKNKTWELMTVVSRFLVHPNPWIREASISFISTSSAWITRAEVLTIVEPMLAPFLRGSVSKVTDVVLTNNLKRHIQRTIYDAALNWASGISKTGFWSKTTNGRTGVFRDFTFYSNSQEWQAALAEVQTGPRGEEDRNWLQKLRNLGMVEDEEQLLIFLRDYVYRTAQRRAKPGSDMSNSRLNSVIALQTLDITPQTIFFDENGDDRYPALQQFGTKNVFTISSPSGTRSPQVSQHPDRQTFRLAVDNGPELVPPSRRSQKTPSMMVCIESPRNSSHN
ncbi:hypothetical protein ABW19_dt0206883 [Dactylella cylindrospora]|nr:hypothetical protein ABW19_dt0206883 [Dactylella cylindrospora]